MRRLATSLFCAATMLTACGSLQPTTTPIPLALPDTIYTTMAPIPIVTVDTLIIEGNTNPRALTIGRFSFQDRVIWIWRGVKDPATRLKIIRHEWCHAVVIEVGLTNHIAPEVTELLCDAIARELVSESSRRRP